VRLQATRNGSDLWLSRWVSHTPPGPQQPPRAAPASPAVWCSGGDFGASPGVPLPACMPTTPAQGSLGNSSWAGSGTSSSAGGSGSHGSRGLHPDVRFYLTVLLAIAGANSVFTLVRAFSFAKGGLVAAQASACLLTCRCCGQHATARSLAPALLAC
jgi:ATP-binding cassette subfamily C (CFTR/MRP) protein 10